jgi:SAM-dependent methyltransferase
MAPEPLAEAGFHDAEAYARGRPGYAPAAVRRLTAELGLTRASRLLDLAAGTGQVSRAFAPAVGSIVAVEPSRSMRRLYARSVPAAELLAGVAERLPLEDRSVDAVVVGEAFHWFDGPAAVAELARILRPGGGLGLLWNVPVGMAPPWPAELGALLERHRAATVPAERRYASGRWRAALLAGGTFTPPASCSAEHEQRLDHETLVAQVASWSFIAALPEAASRATLARVGELAPRACTITFRTDAYWTRPRR